MPRPAATALLATLLFGPACADDGGGFQVVPADGFFEPTTVDFGPQEVGTAAELDVRLTNNGGETLELRALDFEPRLDVFAVRATDGSVRGRSLPPGRSVDLVVVFGPSAAGRFESELLLSAESLQVVLPVQGEGFVVAPARFEGPETLTFADPVEVGRQVTLPFGLRNVGERPGRIVSAAPSGPFVVTGPGGAALSGSPEVLPGDRAELELRFRPTAAGPAQARLTIVDAAGAAVRIDVTGEAVSPGNLTCTPTELTFGDVARGAIARRAVGCTAEGGPVTLTAADLEVGAVFAIEDLTPGLGAPVRAFSLDVRLDAAGVSGLREDELTLVTAHGATVQIPVSATVAPPAPAELDLSVTLTWSDDVDLDLHLVRVPATPYAAGEDCHWDAATLDWGQGGAQDDDPFLDRDARRGPGTEVVNLASATDQTFDVWVQFFDPNQASKTTPVSFDLAWSLGGGAATGTQGGVLEACGQMRRVGRIDLGAPSFTPVDEVSEAFAGFTFRCGP